MVELSEAYVIGVLAEVEQSAPRMRERLAAAESRASEVDAALSDGLTRLVAARHALGDAETGLLRLGDALSEANQEAGTLHREIATFRGRVDELQAQMQQVEPTAQRELRRQRAKLLVQIEDRELALNGLGEQVETVRAQLRDAEQMVLQQRDQEAAVTRELDALQAQLPDPSLYTECFEVEAALANCYLHLDGDVTAWRARLLGAIAHVVRLHEALREGKYRLDQNNELVGGRAMATAEALYAAVVLGEWELARHLFDVATDPALFFHQIFNVFRVWCLGFLVHERFQELGELLRTHRYTYGLRGGYVQAFTGLLRSDPETLRLGLHEIVQAEWRLWQDPKSVRGVGLVSFGAAAFCTLAGLRGVRVAAPGPTVPAVLLVGSAPAAAGGRA